MTVLLPVAIAAVTFAVYSVIYIGVLALATHFRIYPEK